MHMNLQTLKVNSINIPHEHMSETRGLIDPRKVHYVDEQ
jgi:hypothetical protein